MPKKSTNNNDLVCNVDLVCKPTVKKQKKKCFEVFFTRTTLVALDLTESHDGWEEQKREKKEKRATRGSWAAE